MRHYCFVILTYLLLLPCTLLAQDINYSKGEVETLLTKLDSTIAHKKEFQQRRQMRADSIERIVNSCPREQYIDQCKQLYNAYSDFDGRHALRVLEMMEKAPQYKTDSDLRAWVMLNRSHVYGIMGLYHKANDLIDEIDPSQLSKQEQIHYYNICLANYEKIADYISDISILHDEELNMIAYYDQILALQPDSIMQCITTANKEAYLSHPNKALASIKYALPNAKGKERVRLLLAMANISRQLNNQENHVYYLAQAAIDNIQNGATEYMALIRLTHAIYETDINRAYNYLLCMMEDANNYPSRSLSLDVSRYFPLLNTKYGEAQKKTEQTENTRRNSLIITFILLALSIGVTLLLGWRQNSVANEKKRANELLKALDQATIADRVKTVFIQNMRHEIRTPLNAIMGFAQLMSNDLSDEERTLYNGFIQESNNQLLSTLDNIIDVSNMEVGTFNFQFSEFSVDQLCRERMENVRELLPANVAYTYQPMEEGLMLRSDRQRVGQVLHNLLANACKYTTTGSITLNVAHYIAEDCIQFVVTDTGPGVPPDKAKVIFEHFEKLDQYSPGLGLGLYVCHLIAVALGGDIYLDTRYDTGARFVFTVPNHKEKESNDSSSPKSQKNRQRPPHTPQARPQ